jgi:hypothetical protein
VHSYRTNAQFYGAKLLIVRQELVHGQVGEFVELCIIEDVDVGGCEMRSVCGHLTVELDTGDPGEPQPARGDNKKLTANPSQICASRTIPTYGLGC